MNNSKQEFPYEDMINLKHYQSKNRPHMTNEQRAAQFAPFAALTGYGDAIDETARITENRIELTEDEQTKLREKLIYLLDCLQQKPEVTFTYFVEDNKKLGGNFKKIKGIVKKLDEYKRIVEMDDLTRIAIDDIVDISGELYDNID